MTRNGGFENANLTPQIDNLDYTYFDNSNQLKRVTDSTNDSQGFNNGSSAHNDDYTYDTYGNMISDTNKNITQIRYNHQNLPTEIIFANNQKISYLYDASGTKLQKQVQYTNYTVTTDYIGGYQYETKPVEQGGLEHPQLLFFPTAEGYVKAIYKMDPIETEPRGYQYVYIYKDHLGNNRLSYTLDPETEQVKILEENHYYPFGLKHNAYVPTKKDIKYQELAIDEKEIKQVQPAEVVYKYKYQSQERQDELNLNWDSFKYRNYDYAIGRFMSIDPLAEKYPYNSTYAFQENKMGLGRELEGLELTASYSKDGKSVTLTYKVKPINNATRISQSQFTRLIQERKALDEKIFSGNPSTGLIVKFEVVFDKNATIKWEYNDSLDVNDTNGQILGNGHTDKNGDIENNRTQVAIYNLEESDLHGNNRKFTDKSFEKAATTGAHEDGHVMGLLHPDDIKNDDELKNKVEKDENNLMQPDAQGRNLFNEQREKIIENEKKYH